MTGASPRPWLLGLDTATSRLVVAAGEASGQLIGGRDEPAGYRHGERLVPAIEELLAAAGLSRAGLQGVIVGTGPGAFTGLRVGLATAKTLAHASGLPIVGIATGSTLIGAAARAAGVDPASVVLLLPAGPHDRVEVRVGRPARLLPGGSDPELDADDLLVAVDLDGRVEPGAAVRGQAAVRGLAAELVRLGAERLGRGETDDAAELVPDYVTLPRGVRSEQGEIEWSRGPR